MSSIIDNKDHNLLVDHVNKLLDNSQFSRMAVGYFYLSGFEAIREKLDKIQHLKLIIGNRTNQATLEELVEGHEQKDSIERKLRQQQRPGKQVKKTILEETKDKYDTDLELMEQTESAQKGLAALWELIKDNRIEIRMYTKGTLHSKAYIFDLPDKDYLEGVAIVGSSNLSISGLRNNSELNVKITNPNDYIEVKRWFDNLWDECEPFSEAFMNIVEESWYKKQVSPFDVYIKTLYNLVKDRIEIREHSLLTEFDQSILFPFQRDAVNLSLSYLEKNNGVFVSDVVGLGKSYIALAIISHYRSIKRENTLVVCPASLVPMWESYRQEFGMYFEILSSSELLYGENEETYTLNDELRFESFGLIIIDEAHNFRNKDSQRYRILQPYLLNRKVVLLTATPQNNSVWDVYHQIKLFHQEDKSILNITPNNLRSYFSKYQENPEKIAELLQNFMIRRTRQDILKSPRYKDLHLKFPPRKLSTLEYNIEETYSDKKGQPIHQTIIELMFKTQSSNRYKYTIYDLTSFLKPEVAKSKKYVGLSYLGELTRGLLKVLMFKRLESSVQAFYMSIERMLHRHNYMLQYLDKGLVVTGKLDKLQLFLNFDEDGIDDNIINLYPIDDFDINRLKKAIEEDKAILENVLTLVQPVKSNPAKDAKLQCFLKEVIEKHKSDKILIFSEFTDTVNYIHEQIQTAFPKIVSNRISSSSHNAKEKAAVVRRFSPKSQTRGIGLNEGEKEIQIIVTTDVLSEGQNLQDCHIVVNYDFHWNPVRLIQRIGRVDRIGSEAKRIDIYNFLPDRSIERSLRLQERVQNRINEIQTIFGSDGRILSEDETLNERSVFAIYADNDENVLHSDDNILTIYDKAENLLLQLQKDDPEEYNRITNLKDGVRTSCKVDNTGFYAYFRSGNIHRMYFNTGEKTIDNIPEILKLIEAKPNDPKPVKVDEVTHTQELQKLYAQFKNELIARQTEMASVQRTSEQEYFLNRLLASFNLFNDKPDWRKKVNELHDLYSKPIPDHAKRLLRNLKRVQPSDEKMVESLQDFIASANIREYQDREMESEQMMIRTICSESLI
jgi:superfamily II DNA or RNA helicase